MVEWKLHDKWAYKLGIPEDVSRYVNIIIDAIPNIPLPQEYLNFVDEVSEKMAPKKHRGAIIYAIKSLSITHDSGGRKKSAARFASEVQLSFFSQKGNIYVKAWYLHHILDYMNFWVDFCIDANIDMTFDKFIVMFKKKRPIDFPDDILNFVKDNFQEIKEDIIEEQYEKSKGMRD